MPRRLGTQSPRSTAGAFGLGRLDGPVSMQPGPGTVVPPAFRSQTIPCTFDVSSHISLSLPPWR